MPGDCTASEAGFINGTCYRLYGRDKPVVILIHGFGLTQDMWRCQLDALCKAHTVLTYDLTGMGNSEAPVETPNLSMFARQLAGLMDELGIVRAVIAGFSLGGMIARRFAMDFPEKVSALAILHSAYKRTQADHDAIQARVHLARQEGPQATIEAALSRWFSETYRATNRDVMDWVRTTILANDKEVFPKNYQVLVDGVEELAAPQPPIPVPALVMTGEEDYGNSVEMTHQIAAEIPASKIVILPKLRHMAMMEAPDLFNRHLLEFLSDLEPNS